MEGDEEDTGYEYDSEDEDEDVMYDSKAGAPGTSGGNIGNFHPNTLEETRQSQIEAASNYLYQSPMGMTVHSTLVPGASVMNPTLLRVMEIIDHNFLCMWPEHNFSANSAALYFAILTSESFNPDPNGNIDDLLCAFEYACLFARSMAILDLPKVLDVITAANQLREIIVPRHEELRTISQYKKLVIPLIAFAISTSEFLLLKDKFSLNLYFECLEQALNLVRASGQFLPALVETAETMEMLMLFPNGPCDVDTMVKLVGLVKLDSFMSFQKIRTYMYLLTFSAMQILADIFMPISEWQPGRPLNEMPLDPNAVMFASTVHEKYTHLCNYLDRPDNLYLRPYFRPLDMLLDGAAGYMSIIAIRLGLDRAVALHDVNIMTRHLAMQYKDKWRTLSLSYGLVLQATFILEPEAFAGRLAALDCFDDAFASVVRNKLKKLGRESGLISASAGNSSDSRS